MNSSDSSSVDTFNMEDSKASFNVNYAEEKSNNTEESSKQIEPAEIVINEEQR